MIRPIERVSMTEMGQFLRYDGKPESW